MVWNNKRRDEWRKKNPIKRLLAGAKRRSIKSGIEFTVEESDIFIPEYCPLLGIRRILDMSGGYEARDFSPSLDRKDPDLGYTPGNIWVISFRANRIKYNATTEELIMIGDYYRKEAQNAA